MTSNGWTIPQSGGSSKLTKHKATRTKRSECVSIMPDGTTRVFRAAAGERKPSTRAAVVSTVTKTRMTKQDHIAMMLRQNVGHDFNS